MYGREMTASASRGRCLVVASRGLVGATRRTRIPCRTRLPSLSLTSGAQEYSGLD
jgi:hypothetical protein